MFRELFSASQLLDLPVLTMLGFFAAFGAVAVWTLTTRRQPHFHRMSRLPLEDSDQ